MSDVSLPRTISPGVLASWVQENDEALRDGMNGELDGDNLTTSARQRVGLNDSTTTRAGLSYIATSEAIAGTTLAALATPDRVTNVVVATSGLLFVSVWARLLKTVGNASETASVGLFLNGTQVKSQFGAVGSGSTGLFGTTGIIPSALVNSEAAAFTSDTDTGMASLLSTAGSAVDNTTAGHPVGVFVPIVVAPGTYTVELRWAKVAGAIAVSDRRLYVESRTF